MLIQMTVMARIFIRRGISPPDSKLRMMDPKWGLLMSQVCNLSDDLAKQNPDSSTRGTVGNSGRKAPITPSAREILPATINNACFNGVIIF